MDILFKSSATGVAETVDYYEFKDRIEQGKVQPEDEVCDRVLTDDEWRPVDNLNLYHSLSPYRRAAWLARRERTRNEERERNAAARAQLDQQQCMAEKFFHCGEPKGDSRLIQFHRFLMDCEEQPLALDATAVRFTYIQFGGFFVHVSNRTGVWELRCQESGRPKRCGSLPTGVDGQQILTLAQAVHKMPQSGGLLGCDGSQWALESVLDGIYAMQHRWSPSSRPEAQCTDFVALGRGLAKAAGLWGYSDEFT